MRTNNRAKFHLAVNKWISVDGNDNLMQPVLFQTFKHVKQVFIHHGSNYPFSLLSLLDIIQNTAIDKFTICLGKSRTVSAVLSSISFPTIKKQYKASKLDINVNPKKSHEIMICRE